MFNNKKRTDTTYLKIKDGKVVNTPNPYPTEEDNSIDLQEKEFHKFNEEVNNEENNPQNKKSKMLLIVGLIFVIIPFLMIGLNVGKGYLSQLQEYMILGENKSDTNIDDTNSDIISPSILNKVNISDVLDVTNTVNTSFTTSYSGLKTDIILFTENRESLYATKNKLEARKAIIESNKTAISNKQALLVKNKQSELYNVFMERFDLLIDTIKTLDESISRKTAVDITNNAIVQDNLLLDKEIELLKTMLKDNNVNFTETENGISIKE